VVEAGDQDTADVVVVEGAEKTEKGNGQQGATWGGTKMFPEGVRRDRCDCKETTNQQLQSNHREAGDMWPSVQMMRDTSDHPSWESSPWLPLGIGLSTLSHTLPEILCAECFVITSIILMTAVPGTC
jgi:hypothetical protein